MLQASKQAAHVQAAYTARRLCLPANRRLSSAHQQARACAKGFCSPLAHNAWRPDAHGIAAACSSLLESLDTTGAELCSFAPIWQTEKQEIQVFCGGLVAICEAEVGLGLVGQEKGTADIVLAVFQWYMQRVLPQCTGIDISHEDLMWHLSRDDR